jgi:hypothetical protein
MATKGFSLCPEVSVIAVVARRLDGEGRGVERLAGRRFVEGQGLAVMFMVTGIDIPPSGCCEIAARYIAEPGDIQTLTYTMWVSR